MLNQPTNHHLGSLIQSHISQTKWARKILATDKYFPAMSKMDVSIFHDQVIKDIGKKVQIVQFIHKPSNKVTFTRSYLLNEMS